MKLFLRRTIFFILPFIVLFIITSIYYNDSESADLIRIGYIPNVYKNYRKVFDLNKLEKSTKLSKSIQKKYKVLTIGDSFSEQDGYGYKNTIAEKYPVLHIDRFISNKSNNPIQSLIELVNGDFFDNYKIDYVVLQNVERWLTWRIEKVDTGKRISLQDIYSSVRNHKEKENSNKYTIYSPATIRFPLQGMPNYFFNKNYISAGEVYNYELDTNIFFSNSSQKLLFYNNDVEAAYTNNIDGNINKLNDILNTISDKLNKKKIKLIVLISPDKFDLYYEHIEKKDNLPNPLFFKKFKNVKKDYLYVNAKELLTESLYKYKDVYFYDDTHWSPIASKIIGENIISLLDSSERKNSEISSFKN